MEKGKVSKKVSLSKRGGKDRKPKGNPEEQPCQLEENAVLANYFTQIYNIFMICFRIGSPKMHRRFCIGLPKSIDGSVLALLNLYWPS